MNIIVTGTSKGIGYELVKTFLKDPENKVVAISTNWEGLQNLKKESVNNSNLKIIKMDITTYVDAIFLEQINHFDQLDILVNNAGILINKPFAKTSLEEWRAIFEVNLFAPVRLINLLIDKLEKAKQPHIVNIGSMGGFQGSLKFVGLSAYSASKAALSNLTECLAEELKDKNISVNCLCLGGVDTQMFRKVFPTLEATLRSSEIADYIHEFAQHGQRYINGKVLPIASTTP